LCLADEAHLPAHWMQAACITAAIYCQVELERWERAWSSECWGRWK
jgi:hypothetical protein